MNNYFHEFSSLHHRFRLVLISLLVLMIISAIASGCVNNESHSTKELSTESAPTPEPTLKVITPTPEPTPKMITPTPKPTPKVISTSSKKDNLARVHALEVNVFLKNKISNLMKILQTRRSGKTVYISESLLAEHLVRFKEMYREFLRSEIDRLKSETKRLDQSGVNYEYTFSESGFPMQREEEVLSLAKVLRESVVQVASGGTGFVIGDDLIITNHHVVSDIGIEQQSSVTIRTFAGEKFNAQIVGSDTDWDIALLLSDRSLGSSTLSWGDSRELNQKDPVFMIGHPGQMGNWAVTGGLFVHSSTRPLDILAPLLKAIEGTPGTKTTVLSTLPSRPGSSGSPVFNLNGEVVAVTFGSHSLYRRYCYFIRWNYNHQSRTSSYSFSTRGGVQFLDCINACMENSGAY
jgi:S1-C subfamily serine protease